MNKEKIIEIAAHSEIELIGEPDALFVKLNGEDVTAEIRTNEIGQAASIVSTISEVRKILVEKQRNLGKSRRKRRGSRRARHRHGRFSECGYKIFSDRQTRSPRASAF